MQISFSAAEWVRESDRVRSGVRGTRDVIWAQVRASSFRLKRDVQTRMPVDTGRARASWGNVPSTYPAQSSDGIWEEDQTELSVMQGTRVEYVQYLNEGHSSQAPAGFIDAAETRMKDEFARELIASLIRSGVL